MSLLSMSISGAVMILVISVIRALALHRLPKKTFMALWAVALARLLIPYALPFAFSVYSLAGRLLSAPENMEAAFARPVLPAASVEAAIPSAAAALAPAHAISPWTFLWLTGAIVCGAFFAVAFFKCRREFRTALPVENSATAKWLQSHPLRRPVSIRQSDRISTPLTYGVFRPVVLMPKTIDWQDADTLKYVLAHEYVHIRRFDALTKLALTGALCVHWFNPAVWLMYILANRDMELICDEAVIRQYGPDTKAAYAMALIRMEEIRSGPTPLSSSFSKNVIEERIVAIMKIRKTSLAAAVVAFSLVAGVTTAFATSEASGAEGTPVSTDSPALEQTATTEQDYTVTSYTDPEDGKTYYTWDGGKTWAPMTDKEFQEWLSCSGVEWWTAEEYAAWLENEKRELHSIIGSQSWTPSTGWFTWDEEMVGETIAQYEATLAMLESGTRISKPTADGDIILTSEDPALAQVFTETSSIEVAAGDVQSPDMVHCEEAAQITDCQTVHPTLCQDGHCHCSSGTCGKSCP